MLHARTGALRASDAKPVASILRSPTHYPGASDPAKMVCRVRDLAGAKESLLDIETKMTAAIGSRAEDVLSKIRSVIQNSLGCEVCVTLAKTELSEPTLDIMVRVPTLQSSIPEALLDRVSGLLEGLRFSLRMSPNNQTEYVLGLADEESIRSPGLPQLLKNLARAVELTKLSRLA